MSFILLGVTLVYVSMLIHQVGKTSLIATSLQVPAVIPFVDWRLYSDHGLQRFSGNDGAQDWTHGVKNTENNLMEVSY